MSKWMLMGLSVAVVGATGCGGGNRAERVEKMVQWKVEDALDELDATQAQRERVQAITKDAIANAKPLEVHQLLTPKQREQVTSRIERFEKHSTK